MISYDLSDDMYSYEQILRAFAFNLVRNKEETEDLIQDTFCRAIANKNKFAEGTNLKAWLFTIMKNIFINKYRKDQKSNVITDTSDNQYLLNSTKQTLTNDAERTLLGEVISQAMADVNHDFTLPFMLYYEGFKYQEIAEQLSIPLGTVKSRIFFARKEIQSRLREIGIDHSQN